jgi:predicted protein tyrosine phosphatase
MFEYKVVGYLEATELLDKGWPTHAISVLQRSAGVVSRGPHHLVIPMSDVRLPQSSPDAPTIDHIRQVLDFTTNLAWGDRVLVHCWMGYSRSPAVMIAILMQHGYDYQTAYDEVVDENRMIVPNKLVCRHIKTIFQ